MPTILFDRLSPNENGDWMDRRLYAAIITNEMTLDEIINAVYDQADLNDINEEMELLSINDYHGSLSLADIISALVTEWERQHNWIVAHREYRNFQQKENELKRQLNDYDTKKLILTKEYHAAQDERLEAERKLKSLERENIG